MPKHICADVLGLQHRVPVLIVPATMDVEVEAWKGKKDLSHYKYPYPMVFHGFYYGLSQSPIGIYLQKLSTKHTAYVHARRVTVYV